MELNETSGNLTCHSAIQGYHYFAALLGILVTAVGTVGNVTTLLAFATDRRLRTRFNLLILNLTLADLCYCAFLQPVTVDTYLHFGWRQGGLACRLFGLTLFVANSVSIFNLVLIAASRYVLISDPQRFDRVFSWRAMPLFVLGPWALGLSLFGPLWNIYVFLPPVCTCSFHRSLGRPYTSVLMSMMFGLGLGSIGIFYLLIHRKVQAASRALEQHRPGPGQKIEGFRPPAGAELSHTDSGVGSQGGPGESRATQESRTDEGEGEGQGQGQGGGQAGPPPASAQPTKAAAGPHQSRRSQTGEFRRVTRMCFAMFVVYVTCYLPFCVLHIADRRERAPILAHTIAGNLTWLNSCINPILYAVMNRQFREAYAGVLTKAVRGLRRLWSCCLRRG